MSALRRSNCYKSEMDDFTQSMLDRARQRREALSSRMATDITNSSRKRHVAQDYEKVEEHLKMESVTDLADDSPNKRCCVQDVILKTAVYSPAKDDLTSSRIAGGSPLSSSCRNRFAALAQSINNWEDEAIAKKEKRQAPVAPALLSKPSPTVEAAPPKPPRMMDETVQEIENVDPNQASLNKVKSQAPVPPDSGVDSKSHISSAQLTFVIGSPVKAKITPVKQDATLTTANLPIAIPQEVIVETNMKTKAALAVTANASTAVTTSLNNASSTENVTMDEPVMLPVSARLAAWQSKEAGVNQQKEPLPVTARVKNYENTVRSGDYGRTKPLSRVRSKTEIVKKSSEEKLRSPSSRPYITVDTTLPQNRSSPQGSVKNRTAAWNVGSPSHRATITKSPSIRRDKSSASPAKKGGFSPAGKSNLSPATRAVQEKLIQLCGSGNGSNEVAERERQQRAAELRCLENRWQAETDNSTVTSIVSTTACVKSSVDSSPVPADSIKKTGHTPVPAPRSDHADGKREAAREKMRSEFEGKLKMMGFDVSSSKNVATYDLKKPKTDEKKVTKNTASSDSILMMSKSTTPAGSSLYSLIKKQQPVFPVDIVADSDSSFGSDSDNVVHTIVDGDASSSKCVAAAENTNADVGSVPSMAVALSQSECDEQKTEVLADGNSGQGLEEGELVQTGIAVQEEDDSVSDNGADDDSYGDDGDSGESDESDNDEDEAGQGEIDDLLDEALTDETADSNAKAPSALVHSEEPTYAVVMRKKSVKRQASRNENYISLQEYRRQTARPKSQCASSSHRSTVYDAEYDIPSLSESSHYTDVLPKLQNSKQPQSAADNGIDRCRIVSPHKKQLLTVVRQSEVSRHEEDDRLPFIPEKSVKQRLQELQEMVNQELNVIQQTSNALNQCCHSNSAFAGSAEAVECHRLLLTACKKREAYMIEMQKLREGQPLTIGSENIRGRLTLSEIKLPLKPDFMSKIGTAQDTSIFYFIVMIRHGSHVIFTQMVSTHDAMVRGSLDFPNLINLNNINENFVVDVEIFGMSIMHNLEAATPKKKSKSASCTPKKLTPFSKFQSPAGPYAVRTSNFVHISSLQLTKAHLTKTHFGLDRVPFSFPLQGSIHVRLNCLMQSNIEERGFLTMFEDVSGFGAWHRRWCALKNNAVSFWKYPDDEKDKEPIGVIDLKRCITGEVGLVSRDVCARPNTFELKTVRRQQQGERETLVTECSDTMSVTKYWLSADTKEERLVWCKRINDTLASIRAWQSDAMRPVKQQLQTSAI